MKKRSTALVIGILGICIVLFLAIWAITQSGKTPNNQENPNSNEKETAQGTTDASSSDDSIQDASLTLARVEAMKSAEKVEASIQEAPTSINLTHTANNEKVITSSDFKMPEALTAGNTITFDVILMNHMVLQANMPVRLWGTTTEIGKLCARVTNTETEEVRLFYSEAKDGKWEMWLGATDYGGPYTIEIIAESGKYRKLTDVVFGEVFVLGGQSNMGWSINQCYGATTSELKYQDIIDTCKNDMIRYMAVWPVSSEERVDALPNCRGWQKISKGTVGDCSAVGYFFARQLQEKLGVPVGVMSACMGGTGIDQWYPGAVWYNGMVAPITNIVARGVLWYQGEGDPIGYADRLAEMIEIWRDEFENPEMLFHVIQLPRYVNADSWYKCREEDKKVCSMVDGCTYSVNIDTGMFPHMKAEGDTLNDDGIHPYQKLEVGSRAADAMLEKVYGATGTWTSPYLAEAKPVEDGSVILQFNNVGSGLMLRGLAGFEAAGSNGIYYDAKPELINDTTVRITCDEVKEIARVRYGYTNTSSLMENEVVTDCAECVCLYGTLGTDRVKGYPAEQFEVAVIK